MRVVAVVMCVTLTVGAGIGGWYLVTQRRHDDRCRRYHAALVRAYADPNSFTPVVGLTKDDTAAVEDDRNRYTDGRHAQSIPARSPQESTLRNAWNNYIRDEIPRRLALHGC